jgi:large subunit ribosomal protein L25
MSTQAIQMKVQSRSQRGSRANQRLRDAGTVPGVIYGHKEAVLPISMNRKELTTHLNKGAHVFTLNLEGKNENVLVKDVQFDHLGIEVLHIDFSRVSFDERVKVKVPVVLKGEPKGHAEGGVLQQIILEMEVECGVLEIPDAIIHNVAEMGLNEILHVKDIKYPAGIKPLTNPELIVAQCRVVLEEAAVAGTTEGGVEPEVIGRKATEEEGEEAAAGAGKAPAAKAPAAKAPAAKK